MHTTDEAGDFGRRIEAEAIESACADLTEEQIKMIKNIEKY